MTPRNNVTPLLDSKGIEYISHELPNQKFSALEAAAHIGVDAERVFKTMVSTIVDNGKPLLALVPAQNKYRRRQLREQQVIRK